MVWNIQFIKFLGYSSYIHNKKFNKLTWQKNVRGSTALYMLGTITPETVLFTECWPLSKRTFSILWSCFANRYEFNKCFIFIKCPFMKFYWGFIWRSQLKLSDRKLQNKQQKWKSEMGMSYTVMSLLIDEHEYRRNTSLIPSVSLYRHTV
jgi:REP element-mobilizing transposase RayT